MSHGHHHGGHHSGHAGHHHHNAGGHVDKSAIWNSAMQSSDVPRNLIDKLWNPNLLPIFIALSVFILMLMPFIIDLDYDALIAAHYGQSR